MSTIESTSDSQHRTQLQLSRRVMLKRSGLVLAGLGLRTEIAETAQPIPAPRVPLWLTQFDLCTQNDLYYRRLIAPDLLGDNPGKWPLISGIISQVGKWLAPYLDAPKIANIVTSMMPLSDTLLPKYDALVSECARILHVPKPKTVTIDEDQIHTGHPHVYLVELSDENILVISSKLLKLYADSQEELRFLIGRELTRVKCQHSSIRRASFAIQMLLQAVPKNAWTAAAVDTLATLHMGYFLSWCRESEISADHGGLLCCQDRVVAERALLRQHCNLDPTTVAAYGGRFDPDAVVKAFESWENKPFVEFINKVRSMVLTCPYVTERIAAMRRWESSGGVTRIVERTAAAPDGQHFDIQSIKLSGLADKDKTDNVYLKVLDWDKEVLNLKSDTQRGVREATWKSLQKPIPCDDGKPLFFEVYSEGGYGGLVSDSLLGMFVLYPERGGKRGLVTMKKNIVWSVHERKSISRLGTAEVTARFLSG